MPSEAEGIRECHINADFLLIYPVENDGRKGGVVMFVRAGTHADLFR